MLQKKSAAAAEKKGMRNQIVYATRSIASQALSELLISHAADWV
jgi:hypothetical protein